MEWCTTLPLAKLQNSHFTRCCADLLLRTKLFLFLFFSSLWIVSDGGTNDTHTSPWEAHFLTGLLPPVLPPASCIQPPHHSQNDLLQHASDPINYRIKTKYLGMDYRSFVHWLLPFSSASFLPLPLPVFLALLVVLRTQLAFSFLKIDL